MNKDGENIFGDFVDTEFGVELINVAGPDISLMEIKGLNYIFFCALCSSGLCRRVVLQEVSSVSEECIVFIFRMKLNFIDRLLRLYDIVTHKNTMNNFTAMNTSNFVYFSW